MKRFNKGITIIEILIGITLLALVVGSILGAFIVVQRYFKDTAAMINSQATARIVMEKIVRPVRHGGSFTVSDGGNVVTLTRYDGSVDTFSFTNGDGDDETFDDNIIEHNGNMIATNIVRIPGEDIFQELEANERIEINFGVKNEGVKGHYKEIHISTEMNLRN